MKHKIGHGIQETKPIKSFSKKTTAFNSAKTSIIEMPRVTDLSKADYE